MKGFPDNFEDRQNASDYIPSILDDEEDDENPDFPEGFFPLEEDQKTASEIYTESNKEEVVRFDYNDWSKEQLFSADCFKKLIENGITEFDLRKLPIEKLRIILRGNGPNDVVDLIKGKNVAYYRFKGIGTCELIDIIDKMDVEKISLFLHSSFNVLAFTHYNNAIALNDVFKLPYDFIILLLHQGYPLSKLIESNKGITLNEIIAVGYETARKAITYLPRQNRNHQISFARFVRLFQLHGREISDMFERVKVYPNDTNLEAPLARLKRYAISGLQKHNKSRDIVSVMAKHHINDGDKLLLCDILFSNIDRLIDCIETYPSSKYNERGMDYIIKLYEEQSCITKVANGNKIDVKGRFCGFILYYIEEIQSILMQDLFSLDDMQVICNEYPQYLRDILVNIGYSREWTNKKEAFYREIGLDNGDEVFRLIKEGNPVLFVFYVKFREVIQEYIGKGVIILSDIEFMYKASVASLDKFFRDKDAVLKWHESKSEFYNEIGLDNGDDFFRNPNRERMSLFMLVVKFREEILYMHQNGIMMFDEVVKIYDEDQVVLECIFNNFHKMEDLRRDKDYGSSDEILSLFKARGNDCLKQVDLVNGGILNHKDDLTKSENLEPDFDRKLSFNRRNKGTVLFDSTAKLILFRSDMPVDALRANQSVKPPSESTTILPELHSNNAYDASSVKNNNLKKLIDGALSTSLPWVGKHNVQEFDCKGHERKI